MHYTSNDQWFNREKKIKEKVKETIGAGESGGQGIKEKVKETIGMGSGEKGEGRKGELDLGQATKLEG